VEQNLIDRLSHLLERRSRRGTGTRSSSVADDEAACHAECNAHYPPGPALGLCHATCGVAAAQASGRIKQSTLTGEAACHAECNANVPPGPALGLCHAECGIRHGRH